MTSTLGNVSPIIAVAGEPRQHGVFPDFVIEPFSVLRSNDVRRICVETSFQATVSESLRRNPDVITALSTDPYMKFRPDLIFVVRSGVSGQTVGYIAGCPDTRLLHAQIAEQILPRLKRRVMMHGLLLRPRTAGFFWQYIIDSLVERADLEFDNPTYPAHLHINLLPEARGYGIGSRLIQLMIKRFRERSCSGCFVRTVQENTSAVKFFQAQGFEACESMLTPGLRTPRHSKLRQQYGSRIHTFIMTRRID